MGKSCEFPVKEKKCEKAINRLSSFPPRISQYFTVFLQNFIFSHNFTQFPMFFHFFPPISQENSQRKKYFSGGKKSSQKVRNYHVNSHANSFHKISHHFSHCKLGKTQYCRCKQTGRWQHDQSRSRSHVMSQGHMSWVKVTCHESSSTSCCQQTASRLLADCQQHLAASSEILLSLYFSSILLPADC